MGRPGSFPRPAVGRREVSRGIFVKPRVHLVSELPKEPWSLVAGPPGA